MASKILQFFQNHLQASPGLDQTTYSAHVAFQRWQMKASCERIIINPSKHSRKDELQESPKTASSTVTLLTAGKCKGDAVQGLPAVGWCHWKEYPINLQKKWSKIWERPTSSCPNIQPKPSHTGTTWGDKADKQSPGQVGKYPLTFHATVWVIKEILPIYSEMPHTSWACSCSCPLQHFLNRSTKHMLTQISLYSKGSNSLKVREAS